jgi:hypothetical protein
MKQACGIAAKPARNLVGRGMLAQHRCAETGEICCWCRKRHWHHATKPIPDLGRVTWLDKTKRDD